MSREPPVHLDMVAVHFSTRCGSHCQFCYFGNPLAAKEPHTPLPLLDRIIRRLAEEGVREVLFVGGDPVLHPAFAHSLELAKELHLQTSVLSNSWALRPETDFATILRHIDYCEATILGHNALLHDEMAGAPGAYQHLITRLRRICDAGRQIGICLNATPQTLPYLYEMVHQLMHVHGLALRTVMFQRIVPSGKSTGVLKFGLNLDDVEQLMQQVDKIHRDLHLPITFEDPVPHCTVKPEYRHYLSRCEWGYTKASVNSRGELNRCGADDHYRLGTIFDEPLQQKWSTNSILRTFRNKEYLPDECRHCDLLEGCGGGCALACGTHQDHDLDVLYLQRKDQQQCGTFSRLTVPESHGHVCTRPAGLADWNAICILEQSLFPKTSGLFSFAALDRIKTRCGNGLHVVENQGKIIGYASVVPLTSAGRHRMLADGICSVCELALHEIGASKAESEAMFVEVIAFAPNCPQHLRIGLWRWLTGQVRGYSNAILTSPVSAQGEQIVMRRGWHKVRERDGRKLYGLNLENA